MRCPPRLVALVLGAAFLSGCTFGVVSRGASTTLPSSSSDLAACDAFSTLNYDYKTADQATFSAQMLRFENLGAAAANPTLRSNTAAMVSDVANNNRSGFGTDLNNVANTCTAMGDPP